MGDNSPCDAVSTITHKETNGCQTALEDYIVSLAMGLATLGMGLYC